MRYLLADVNVWLSTLVADHPHHKQAVRWWNRTLEDGDSRVAFCRITQLGLLRLLTNLRVMGEQRRTHRQAWSMYEHLLAQPPVVFAPEPEGTEEQLAGLCGSGGASRKFWTDGYLAALAMAGGLGLATFDRDFKRYPDLNLELLDL